MPYTLPRLEDLFSSVDPNDAPALASRLALCKSAVADSEARTERGEFTYLPGRLHADRPATPEMLLDQLTKSVNPDVLAAVAGQVDQLKGQLADLGKDLSLTSPLSTGLIPYDLEAPAKLLTPRPTPLRNRLPRLPGQGTTRAFRRILGFTGTGTGGVGYTTPFLNDSSTMTSGSLTLRRAQHAHDDPAGRRRRRGRPPGWPLLGEDHQRERRLRRVGPVRLDRPGHGHRRQRH